MNKSWFIPFIVFLAFCGCGGGTSGSGIKTYEGTVSTTDGRALTGVHITIEATGDNSFTDANGAFAIKSDASGQEVSFLLESPEFENRFVLQDIPSDSSGITVEVTVDTETDVIQVSNVTLRAWFAGLCDQYFENREIIRQANRIPKGTVCSLNVEVLGDGKRLPNIPLALEYAACEPGSPWRVLQNASTGAGPRAGSAEINFEFKDSEQFCRYRVVLTERIGNSQVASYPIDTFSEQEFFEKIDEEN